MGETLAIVAIVVAVLVGGATLALMFYLDRKRNPHREFTYEVTASPLVSNKVRNLDALRVSYDSKELTQPYLVTVQVGSTGRADIPKSSFDGPVLFKLNVPILVEIEQAIGAGTVSARLEFQEGESVVKLPPSTLPKDFAIRATYLCEGKPDVQPIIEMPDIPTSSEFQTSPSRDSYVRRAVLSSVVAVVATLLGAAAALLAAQVTFVPLP